MKQLAEIIAVPVDEIVSEWQIVMLKGARDGVAGEQYGRSFEKPLVTAVTPYSGGGSSASKTGRRSRRAR